MTFVWVGDFEKKKTASIPKKKYTMQTNVSSQYSLCKKAQGSKRKFMPVLNQLLPLKRQMVNPIVTYNTNVKTQNQFVVFTEHCFIDQEGTTAPPMYIYV